MAGNKSRNGGAKTLLVELLTEELPPKALAALAQAFADEILNGLTRLQLSSRDLAGRRIFATPRRLATLIPAVLDVAVDRPTEVSGPSIKAPAEAVSGFARKHGLEVGRLEQQDTPKGRVFVARTVVKGASLDAALSDIVAEAVKKLPVPKVMRWGEGTAQFARPVHGLVMMHGPRIVPGEVLGLTSGNKTLGHRFLSNGAIALKHAGDYEGALGDKGKVVADFAARRLEITTQLEKAAGSAKLVVNDALLDEITALVEAPAVYAGEFSAEFLAVPEECLILSMQQHQRYVPLRDKATGNLLPRFLFVSNIETKAPKEIVHGNERVLRARLSDAKFFYDQDRRTRLETRVPRLAKVVYHGKLGSQLERVERIGKLAARIAGDLKADVKAAERAAFLCKADLLTEMVGEFPELQGTMGRYYALNDGEPQSIADAIEAYYRPRFSGDSLPASKVDCAVALADKLDLLVGIFGIGLMPTGDKDPFALRRAALGVIRILCEHKLQLGFEELLKTAQSIFPTGKLADSHQHEKISIPNYVEVSWFIKERAKSYLRDLGYSVLEIESVLDLNPIPAQYIGRLEAVRKFLTLPEASSLAESDKRIRNILTKSGGESIVQRTNDDLLQADAEKQLLRSARLLRQQVESLLETEKFSEALLLTAQVHGPVSQFFEKVMVNVEDIAVRNNRFALLHEVSNLTNRVAHIFKLAA